jgi:hypothetical protein
MYDQKDYQKEHIPVIAAGGGVGSGKLGAVVSGISHHKNLTIPALVRDEKYSLITHLFKTKITFLCIN